MIELWLLLTLATTRIDADQILNATLSQSAQGRTRLTVAQVATMEPSQLAGNLRIVVFRMTDADTGAVTQVPAVLIYPPEQWCTVVEPKICP